MRLRFILGLILLGIALQFIAKTINGVLPMMKEAAQYPVSHQALQQLGRSQPPAGTPPQTAALSQVAQQLKVKFKKEKAVKWISPADASNNSSQSSSHAFMQITLEDIRPPVKNKALGPKASARLETFLAHKREQNAQLAKETETLFGPEAQQEVIAALVNDERESLANARTATSATDYATRQSNTDQKTSVALTAIFEKYKKQLNHRLNKNSPAWNEFFKRVNSFQKAAN